MTGLGMAPGSRRKGPVRDERGSMAMLLMVVLVGVMISALLVPMIITQSRITQVDSSRVQALNAAQSGIDVMVGAIRAVDGIGKTLPCNEDLHPGTVSGGSIATYSIDIEYFTFDPVAEEYPSQRKMNCVPGKGTYTPASAPGFATTPGFARLTSTGEVDGVANGSSARRRLTATYVFRPPNANTPGALLQIDSAPEPTALCLTAGTPIEPGTPVTMQPCIVSTPQDQQQVFSYRTDLTLQLLSSITAAYTDGLCLGSPSGDAVRLDRCKPLGFAEYLQQWSYNENGQYQAAQSISPTSGPSPHPQCITAPTPSVNKAANITAVVVLDICDSSAGAAVQKWSAPPEVLNSALTNTHES